MSAQILQDYRDKKRAPVLGPMTYAESAALVAEKDKLLELVDALRLALAAKQDHLEGGRRKTDAPFRLSGEAFQAGLRLVELEASKLEGETA